jgi:hypothetical protein
VKSLGRVIEAVDGSDPDQIGAGIEGGGFHFFG